MKYDLHTTPVFDKWFNKLKDKSIRFRLEARLSRLADGNFGDAKIIGAQLFELRFFFGAGYRIYYTIRNGQVLILLCAGDKSTQSSDIELAKQLLNDL
ncbi:type II toxin-antitoxin system RelE/ParE family toxin [Methylotuvimicrobium buryatense]|uniref:Type II toxin-antitoxin system RelE/ParE family toxin n=1 Tax=Methylotuvimicrobium buryatense TaxID=95641 RepID=A0A4P9UW71_METBY|nr:type II toxin-antitoxin system RelE/ParE family toxin [Methylotuvimicrobium buryatense]QCW83996.1 type II toxin-antitoxin system RelE/ParE family toxin [Methylotuvimicrobium buryatense]